MNDKYFTFDRLNNNSEIIHLYTKKDLDFSVNNVGEEGRKKLISEIEQDFNFRFENIKYPIQTHTNKVCVLTEQNINNDFNEVDGLITNLKNVALITQSADCQSILLYDPVNKVIGNIHSGWKGTLNKIIVNAINLMKSEYNCNPVNIEAYICPSIMNCCFEVDKDLVDSFKENFSDVDEFITLGDMKEGKQKYYIDTIELNKKVLTDLGFKKENIFSSNICTKCYHDTFHSYRYDGTSSGRNIALICLK